MAEHVNREYIKLTPAQSDQVRPYLDRVGTANILGEPGMLVAQIKRYENGEVWMVPCFIPHELAKLLESQGNSTIPGLLRGGREDSPEPHKLLHAGSNPAPATHEDQTVSASAWSAPKTPSADGKARRSGKADLLPPFAIGAL